VFFFFLCRSESLSIFEKQNEREKMVNFRAGITGCFENTHCIYMMCLFLVLRKLNCSRELKSPWDRPVELLALGNCMCFGNLKAVENMCSSSLALPVHQLFSKVANSATRCCFFFGTRRRCTNFENSIEQHFACFFFLLFRKQNTMLRYDASSAAKMIGGHRLSCARAS
jgi:hypothetical protein